MASRNFLMFFLHSMIDLFENWKSTNIECNMAGRDVGLGGMFWKNATAIGRK